MGIQHVFFALTSGYKHEDSNEKKRGIERDKKREACKHVCI